MARFVTHTTDVQSAETFIVSSVDEPHYLFVAKHTSYSPADSSVPDVNTAPHTYTTSLYNDMIFGKRITTNDVCQVIPRYDWVSGTVYDQYDHRDAELLDKEFFVCVDAGASLHVYKCLFNNHGANSTVEPSGQDLEPFITPADGYVWKYMYSFSSAQETKFATDDFIPVVANSSVTAAATGGTVEVIQVEDAGTGYDNHFSSAFRAQDLELDGDETVFGLTDLASSLNGFYANCIIKMTSGSAQGEYRLITNYTFSGGQKKITIESAFDESPAATDEYEIYPAVFVVGDGNETVNCVARAIINSNASNSVSIVEVLDPGESYRVATASIVSHSAVGVDEDAEFTAFVSPAYGHGGDVANELGAKYACVSVKFTGTESDTIPVDNDYRQIGIIKDPRFSNVHVSIDFATQVGNFIPDETVFNFKPTLLQGNATTTANSAVITGDGTDFYNNLDVGDYVIITSGTSNHLSIVTAISNAEYMTVSNNISFANTTATVTKARMIANAIVTSANTSTLVLDSCSGNFKNDFLNIIGEQSFAKVEIDDTEVPNIQINGATVGDYLNFVQMTKFEGSISSGTFSDDETVTQGTATAKLYHVTDSSPDYLYLTNMEGTFDDSTEIVGDTSGAVFTPTNKYPGALELDSGKILYIENLSPITRASNKSETFKVILEF